MKTIHIYGLFDPETDELRYVGKAVDAIERFKRHYHERNLTRPVNRWFKSMVDAGTPPRVEILEIVPENEWEAAERRLIAQYRQTSKLLNLADGGAMPSQTIEQRAKNAKLMNEANRKRVEVSPEMAALIHAKQNIARLRSRFMRSKDYFWAYRLGFIMKCWAAENPERYGSWATL